MARKSLVPCIGYIRKEDKNYPVVFQEYLRNRAPAAIAALGNTDILRKKTLALLCSVKCPGNLILKTYDLARQLRDDSVTVISGFHSPMEKECLNILLRGNQPIIICPARSIEKMRIPKDWRKALEEGRLLLLSPFSSKRRQMNSRLAQKRNEFVATLADKVLVVYANPGGKLDRLSRKIVSCNKPLLAFECKENAHLISIGAKPTPDRERR
jgi:predicted Rossmann fold nucleotide-binding protein DprA/Smf involved in DNA uptake